MRYGLRDDVVGVIEGILNPILLEDGLELVDIQYGDGAGRKYLRIYIDKEGGVTVEDCAKLSRELEVLLDVHDVLPGSYTLEVSSPGINRPLKTPEDFKRFRGNKVNIKTKAEVEGRKVFTGLLVDFEDMEALVKANDGTYHIPYDDIEKANMEFEF